MAPQTNLTQTFASDNVATSQWQIAGYSCLTGGDAGTPNTSIPACPSNNDPNGGGYLRITSNLAASEGFVVSQTPIILQAGHTGITVTFNYYAYGGNGADGLCVFLLDATQAIPMSPGSPGGGLGYSNISNGFVGLGLDSYGNFSNGNGGPGRIPESIAIRGGGASSFAYIGGYQSGGVAASLPFNLDTASMIRPTPLTVSVTFNASPETATVQINRNDGSGFITYVSNLNLGVAGEPAFPSRVYLGFSASNGSLHDYHEVNDVTIAPS